MDKEVISQKVEHFISEQFVFDQEQELNKDDSLLETGTVDSTGMLEVVLFLEENFSIKVKDEDMIPENLDSINRIADYIGRKLAD